MASIAMPGRALVVFTKVWGAADSSEARANQHPATMLRVVYESRAAIDGRKGWHECSCCLCVLNINMHIVLLLLFSGSSSLVINRRYVLWVSEASASVVTSPPR